MCESFKLERQIRKPKRTICVFHSMGRSTPYLASILVVASSFAGFILHRALSKSSSIPSSKPQPTPPTPPLQLAQSILDFWFNSYPTPTLSHRNLWMTSPNTKAQASADTKIASLFTSLLAKFDTPYWLSNGNSNNPTSQTDQITLFTSAIILLDQFPRHIHRTSSSISIPSVSTTDSLALSLSTQFLDSSLLRSQTLPSHYFVFALMPFRHAANMHIELDSSSLPQSATTLRSVLTLIDERESLEAEFDLLRSRFRKASGRRLQGVEDKLRGLATAACE